jgi:hypothetical protein
MEMSASMASLRVENQTGTYLIQRKCANHLTTMFKLVISYWLERCSETEETMHKLFLGYASCGFIVLSVADLYCRCCSSVGYTVDWLLTVVMTIPIRIVYFMVNLLILQALTISDFGKNIGSFVVLHAT